jgi:integrase/recombinase XerD
MVNLSNEITINIINEVVKIIPYLNVDIKKQVELRNKIEEQLNDYEITSKCTEICKGDILEKAFLFLACKRLEGMSETTIYNYTLLFKKMGVYFSKPIVSINTMDLRLFIGMVYKDNQPQSQNSKISKIKAFFGWLQDEGYLIQNPSKNLNEVKTAKRRRTAIESIDVEKMRLNCTTLRDKALFEMIIATGIRVSEASNALLSKINWNDNSLTVIGKGNKERIVYFNSRAKLFLINYITDRESKNIFSDYLFVASKYPYDNLGRRSIERDITRIAESAGVKYDVCVHKLRHTFCQSCIDHKIPLEVTQQLMGHSSSQTTGNYYHIGDNQLKVEYQKIAL